MLCTLLCLAFFTQDNVPINLCCHGYQWSIPCYCWVVFHGWVYPNLFIYSFVEHIDCFQFECLCVHSCTSLCEDIYVLMSISKSGIARSIPPTLFSQQSPSHLNACSYHGIHTQPSARASNQRPTQDHTVHVVVLSQVSLNLVQYSFMWAYSGERLDHWSCRAPRPLSVWLLSCGVV